jgi:hypothetical protein
MSNRAPEGELRSCVTFWNLPGSYNCDFVIKQRKGMEDRGV